MVRSVGEAVVVAAPSNVLVIGWNDNEDERVTVDSSGSESSVEEGEVVSSNSRREQVNIASTSKPTLEGARSGASTGEAEPSTRPSPQDANKSIRSSKQITPSGKEKQPACAKRKQSSDSPGPSAKRHRVQEPPLTPTTSRKRPMASEDVRAHKRPLLQPEAEAEVEAEVEAELSWKETAWLQCNACSKWRRSPWDAEVEKKTWVCSAATWPSASANCEAPEDALAKLIAEGRLCLPEDVEEEVAPGEPAVEPNKVPVVEPEKDPVVEPEKEDPVVQPEKDPVVKAPAEPEHVLEPPDLVAPPVQCQHGPEVAPEVAPVTESAEVAPVTESAEVAPVTDSAKESDISDAVLRELAATAEAIAAREAEAKELWIPAQLSPIQVHQYSLLLAHHYDVLRSGSFRHGDESLRGLVQKLRQCCSHPYIVADYLAKSYDEPFSSADVLDAGVAASGKLQLLCGLMSEFASGNKTVAVLLLPRSKRAMSILERYLRRQFGVESFERIDGEMSDDERLERVGRFNTADSKWFVLLDRSPLPSRLKTIDVVVAYESCWELRKDVEYYAKLRAPHTKVYRLYTHFTVEERVLVAVQKGVNAVSGVPCKVEQFQELLCWGVKDVLKLDRWVGRCTRPSIGWADVISAAPGRVGVDVGKCLILMSPEEVKILASSSQPAAAAAVSDKLKALLAPREPKKSSDSDDAMLYGVDGGDFYDESLCPRDFWCSLLADKHAELQRRVRKENGERTSAVQRPRRKTRPLGQIMADTSSQVNKSVAVSEDTNSAAKWKALSMELCSMCEKLQLSADAKTFAEKLLQHVQNSSLHSCAYEVAMSVCRISAEHLGESFAEACAPPSSFDKSVLEEVHSRMKEQYKEFLDSHPPRLPELNRRRSRLCAYYEKAKLWTAELEEKQARERIVIQGLTNSDEEKMELLQGQQSVHKQEKRLLEERLRMLFKDIQTDPQPQTDAQPMEIEIDAQTPDDNSTTPAVVTPDGKTEGDTAPAAVVVVPSAPAVGRPPALVVPSTPAGVVPPAPAAATPPAVVTPPVEEERSPAAELWAAQVAEVLGPTHTRAARQAALRLTPPVPERRVSARVSARLIVARPQVSPAVARPRALATLQPLSSTPVTSSPVVSLPTSQPVPLEVSHPTSSPAITLPTCSWAISLPTSSPAISLPTSSPAISLPTSSPTISHPTSSPSVIRPTTSILSPVLSRPIPSVPSYPWAVTPTARNQTLDSLLELTSSSGATLQPRTLVHPQPSQPQLPAQTQLPAAHRQTRLSAPQLQTSASQLQTAAQLTLQQPSPWLQSSPQHGGQVRVQPRLPPGQIEDPLAQETTRLRREREELAAVYEADIARYNNWRKSLYTQQSRDLEERMNLLGRHRQLAEALRERDRLTGLPLPSSTSCLSLAGALLVNAVPQYALAQNNMAPPPSSSRHSTFNSTTMVPSTSSRARTPPVLPVFRSQGRQQVLQPAANVVQAQPQVHAVTTVNVTQAQVNAGQAFTQMHRAQQQQQHQQQQQGIPFHQHLQQRLLSLQQQRREIDAEALSLQNIQQAAGQQQGNSPVIDLCDDD